MDQNQDAVSKDITLNKELLSYSSMQEKLTSFGA